MAYCANRTTRARGLTRCPAGLLVRMPAQPHAWGTCHLIITSHHITAHHITSHHIMSCHVMSHHVTLHHPWPLGPWIHRSPPFPSTYLLCRSGRRPSCGPPSRTCRRWVAADQGHGQTVPRSHAGAPHGCEQPPHPWSNMVKPTSDTHVWVHPMHAHAGNHAGRHPGCKTPRSNLVNAHPGSPMQMQVAMLVGLVGAALGTGVYSIYRGHFLPINENV